MQYLGGLFLFRSPKKKDRRVESLLVGAEARVKLLLWQEPQIIYERK